MDKVKTRCYRLDSDTVEVKFHLDETVNQYFGDYPDFEENPRYTPGGRPWVNATGGCEHAEEDFDDCGSCRYYLKENPGDLIGICINEQMREKVV